ncbi:MAG TPA: hydantoinase/oxoprolinase family protein [Gammaproteobacteria bacterium]|nr:hydantoinase/oxoprolinase family protein [Gammaproteobacteria bacterium]HIM88472.1 hydantoinase/oxoprolinase family protein [Gammaproteobacteria bacterium]HIO34807.1 hydantoinase/oxoprolinase family protein [Gammaproteobacteria bacterium]
MAWRLGIDIGGTFTDVALVNDVDGTIGIAKTPTTPSDFGKAVLSGLHDALDRYGVQPDEVSLLSHATTVVTNSILEENGARTALISTRGFRDVLELRRSARSDLYDMFQDPPRVLVPRHRRLEITERLDATGTVIVPLDESEIPGLIKELKDLEVEAVAISLLFSFLNDHHECRLGEALREALPGVAIFLSSEVLPEVREFERTSTTAVCAYVAPILGSYLKQLETATDSLGLPKLHVMGSTGGVFDVREALRLPVNSVESGPAAGVIAAQLVGAQLGETNLISFDMGGTTAKASLIRDGQIEVTADYEVGGTGSQNRWVTGSGHPIRVPVIDLAEVSAGGGSIAWIDPAGSLRVGPHSAGAEPGPVCYGQGGDQPTVTDANLVLGYLDAHSLLGGDLPIDYQRAEYALQKKIGDPMNMTALQAAAAVREIVNNGMAEALRIVSIERGHDPREFSLVAFGGAGPVHAAALADELDIPRIIVPPIPGGFSALGLVMTDVRRDYARTLYRQLEDLPASDIEAVWSELQAQGEEMLRSTGISPDLWRFRRSADLRYSRQAYELNVTAEPGEFTDKTKAELAGNFHSRHEQTYGHKNLTEPVHLVTLRLTAVGELGRLEITDTPRSDGASEKSRRPVWFAQTGTTDCSVHNRSSLAAGISLDGPVIVESLDSTLVVPPRWTARNDHNGFITLERSNRE